jgi:hypothetical protein
MYAVAEQMSLWNRRKSACISIYLSHNTVQAQFNQVQADLLVHRIDALASRAQLSSSQNAVCVIQSSNRRISAARRAKFEVVDLENSTGSCCAAASQSETH